jgi:hypothetical protein
MSGFDFNNQRGSNLGDPIFGKDSVNLRTLQSVILSVSGGTSTGGTSVFITPGSNIQTGGSISNIIISSVANPVFNNLTASGISNSNFIQSGGTDLYSIFATSSVQGVASVGQSTNIVTGGSASNVTIATSLTPVFASVSAVTISASTLYSGSTNLYSIFATSSVQGVASVGQSTNIVTGGSASNVTIATTLTPTFTSLTATTISGATLFSGSTNLYSIFAASGSGVLTVGQGSNIVTGGSASNVTIATTLTPTFTSLTATTISGATLFSGSTNLYSIFATSSSSNPTFVQPGNNIQTGGTSSNPIISTIDSPIFNNITSSGSSSFQALSATTLYSGSTNLYSIFSTSSGGSNIFVAQNSDGLTHPTINTATDILTYNPSATTSTETITLPLSPTSWKPYWIHFGGTLTSGTVVVTSLIISGSVIGYVPLSDGTQPIGCGASMQFIYDPNISMFRTLTYIPGTIII